MTNGDELKDDLETLSPEAEIQKAYDQAKKSPWTIARHSAAMSMGCTILSGVLTTEIDDLIKTGAYPNVLRDVVIVSWLLSLSEAEIIRINCRLNIDAAMADAMLWAEREGIRYGSPQYLNAVTTLSNIVNGIYTSFYGVEGKKPEAHRKNATRPLGKSARPITRSKRAGTMPTTS